MTQPPQKAPGKQKPPRTEQKLVYSGREPKRADLLVQSLCERSRAQIRGMFQNGCVMIDGKDCQEAGTLVENGQTITLNFDPRRKYREGAKEYRSKLFQVVFEDNYLIVVNKQAGYLTMPTEKDEDLTLVRAINDYIRTRGGRAAGASLVHRLDRDTSGLLVLAKHPKLAQVMKQQFKDRKPMREYLAIVRGILQRTEGSFRTHLATDKNLNQHSVKDETKGKLAITHYRVEERLDDCSVVRVRLETGRRNQIRVHFSEIGHPVLGDVRYQPERAKHPAWKWSRLALHAETLGFTHPVKKTKLEFRSPPPEEFDRFLKAVGSKNPKVS